MTKFLYEDSNVYFMLEGLVSHYQENNDSEMEEFCRNESKEWWIKSNLCKYPDWVVDDLREKYHTRNLAETEESLQAYREGRTKSVELIIAELCEEE